MQKGLWLLLQGLALGLLPFLAYRIQVEENLMLQRFGAECRQYQQKTKRLIPGLW